MRLYTKLTLHGLDLLGRGSKQTLFYSEQREYTALGLGQVYATTACGPCAT